MTSSSVIDGRQLRAARAILGWSSAQAAEAAGLHRNSVTRAEAQEAIALHSFAADRLSEAFEKAGVLFGVGEAGPSVAFVGARRRKRRSNRPPVISMCARHSSRTLEKA